MTKEQKAPYLERFKTAKSRYQLQCAEQEEDEAPKKRSKPVQRIKKSMP
jgi:hypothetical protein